MPVRNGGKYIKEAIQSVLGQTLRDFELVIVNDGSDDNTEEIIKSFTDDRIVYLRQEKLGISVALNTGIRNSIGLNIARMDSDDIMLPDRLEKQYKYFLQHIISTPLLFYSYIIVPRKEKRNINSKNTT